MSRRLQMSVLVVGLGVVMGAAAPIAGASGILPPSNPPANIPPSPNFFSSGTCQLGGGLSCTDPCFDSSSGAFPTYSDSAGCDDYVLEAIDAARHREVVGGMQLPSNFRQLTVSEQLFVLAGLERAWRGLPPYVGLVASLNNAAQTAAENAEDPNVPNGFPIASDAGGAPAFGGAWAGGSMNALEADYGWMYDDGWGGPGNTDNLACTSAHAPGCWGHRDELLGSDPAFNPGVGLECSDCLMGAGYARSANGFANSYADLVVRPSRSVPLVFTWAKNVLPYLGSSSSGGCNASIPTNPYLSLPVVCAMAPAANGNGYWLASAQGSVYSFGAVHNYGGVPALHLGSPVIGMAASPGGGYWLVTSGGGVYAFGGAHSYGSLAGHRLNKPIVGMAVTPRGQGYWLVASDGGIFSFGDASFHGSAGGIHLNKPIVGMAATADGKGYWLVASDGGIFTYGDALFHGSAGGIHLNKPIVGMAATQGGQGYWLVASDGGIFTYGDAHFYGSAGALRLKKPIDGMQTTPSSGGYWLFASDGGIFTYGNAGFHGSGT
jgi:hypothetical protein